MSKSILSYQPLLQITIPGVTTEDPLYAHRCVKVDGSFADAAEDGIGVTEVEWDLGDRISAIVQGTAIVDTSEAVSAGDWLSCAADGKVQVQGLGETLIGIALTTVSAAGKIVMLLTQGKVT